MKNGCNEEMRRQTVIERLARGYVSGEIFGNWDQSVRLFVVVLSPFELRTRLIGTTLPHYTEMGHSSLSPLGGEA